MVITALSPNLWLWHSDPGVMQPFAFGAKGLDHGANLHSPHPAECVLGPEAHRAQVARTAWPDSSTPLSA
jgi:hypothetical protein